MKKYEKREAHPMEKYIGRSAKCYGEILEVVGYVRNSGSPAMLIADGTKIRAQAWDYPDAEDVVFKRCEAYCYVSIDNLID